jgi:hypothetical protein
LKNNEEEYKGIVKKRTKVEKGTKQLGNKSKKEGSIEQTRK